MHMFRKLKEIQNFKMTKKKIIFLGKNLCQVRSLILSLALLYLTLNIINRSTYCLSRMGDFNFIINNNNKNKIAQDIPPRTEFHFFEIVILRYHFVMVQVNPE